MHDLNIAAPLAAALAAKGYATLTNVQESVLAEGTQGRDLLVSAQTGSGKTVAFGLAIAGDILEGDRMMPADRPLALAIAPTRELALQVARELDWLYGEAGARIATCVGGMDYRTERRALERGPQIVVGTPGRLRDHIERGGLDLSDLRAAVLDEADEMLDLGFREDLEFILGAAPIERRTLMFSATVPPEIEALARAFQQDALRVVAGGESRQHVDIEYRALSVANRDRENAIFNVLRFYEAPTAIIFCKTRANVNHLLARMGNRGFKVVALSGELSQNERTHALQALRDGRARVCIATDVAARGIDLPGLELVIHADLPTNPETLLHRSGRTGRAGSKGVSALIVTSADTKKAQRLLQRAKVVADWAPAPTADDVQERDDRRLLDHPTLTEAPGDEAGFAATLLERFGPERLASAFVRLWRANLPAPEELTEAAAPAALVPRERREFGDSTWYALDVGHTGRAEARWLLPKICEAGGIGRDSIGAIRVRQDVTYVQIAAEAAPKFGAEAVLADDLTMRRMDQAPDLDGPQAARPERRTEWAERPARSERAERTMRPARAEWTERAERPAPPEASDRSERPTRAPRSDWQPSLEQDPTPAPAPKKQRWSTADKKSRGTAAAADTAKPHTPRGTPTGPAGDRTPGAKPAAKFEGKFAGKAGAKPAARPAWAKPAVKPGAKRGGSLPPKR